MCANRNVQQPMAVKRLEEINNPKKSDEGCFVTTAVCGFLNKPDDGYELTRFRMFRDDWLAKQPGGTELVKEYYRVAPVIVSIIDELSDRSDIYLDILKKYLKPCLNYIESKEFIKCKEFYINMVQTLKNRYTYLQQKIFGYDKTAGSRFLLYI